MQARFTAKGVDAAGNNVVLAYELKEEEFKVNLHITPRKDLNAEQLKKLEKGWVETGEFEFPETTLLINPNLNAESVLPDDIRSEEAGKIRVQQNEWAYQLLTSKLWESYLLELEELKKRSAELVRYDRQLFEDAKSFWGRVLDHRKERDISQQALDKIKDDVNSVFEKLKTFRKTETVEFEAASAKVRDVIVAKLDDIKKRAEHKANFKGLMEDLRALQNDAYKHRFTKNDETLLRKAFDSTFLFVSEQRNHFFKDINESRIKALTEAAEKMESSIARDKSDLEYFGRKSNSKHLNSLEMQLIKVKTNMLNEAIISKDEKLKDIRLTLDKLLKLSQKNQKNELPKESEAPATEEQSTTEDAQVNAGEATHLDEPNTATGQE